MEKILIYDSECVLCSRSIQFLIKNDRTKEIRIASLTSAFSKKLFQRYEIKHQPQNSVVYIVGNQHYLKSTAVLKALKDSKNFWSILYFFILCPRFIRDKIYDYIAKNRHRILTKQKKCSLLSEELRSRVID